MRFVSPVQEPAAWAAFWHRVCYIHMGIRLFHALPHSSRTRSRAACYCAGIPSFPKASHASASIPFNFYSLSVMRADEASIATGDARRCNMHRMRPIRMLPKSPHAQVKNQARSLSRAFSYDLPVISSIPLNILPASGGSAIFIYGTSFGVFACNRSWCSKTHVAGLPVMCNGLGTWFVVMLCCWYLV